MSYKSINITVAYKRCLCILWGVFFFFSGKRKLTVKETAHAKENDLVEIMKCLYPLQPFQEQYIVVYSVTFSPKVPMM